MEDLSVQRAIHSLIPLVTRCGLQVIRDGVSIPFPQRDVHLFQATAS